MSIDRSETSPAAHDNPGLEASSSTPAGSVPCNGCVRCCVGDAIRLLPDDDAHKYMTVPHPFIPGARMLDHKESGACIYLAETGCSIHFDKPRMCREFDCRTVARFVPYTEARKQKIIPIWLKGKELSK